MITSKPLQRHGAKSWPGCQGKEWQPPLEAPPLLVLSPRRYRNKECLHLHLASTHQTFPIGVCLSLRLHRPGDYRHLQEVCPALEDRLQAHGPWVKRPWHCLCRRRVPPRERCQFISRGRTSLLPHISKQHSCRANPLLLMGRWCSHRASLLHHTNRLYSHPGGQQEGDCWPDLPQTEPLLHLTKPSLTVEGNRPGDRASEADQPVTPEEAEG